MDEVNLSSSIKHFLTFLKPIDPGYFSSELIVLIDIDIDIGLRTNETLKKRRKKKNEIPHS